MDLQTLVLALAADQPTSAILAKLPEEVQENVKLGWSRILGENLTVDGGSSLAEVQAQLATSEAASLAKDTLIADLEARLKHAAADLTAVPATKPEEDEPGFATAPAAPAIETAPETSAPAAPAQG